MRQVHWIWLVLQGHDQYDTGSGWSHKHLHSARYVNLGYLSKQSLFMCTMTLPPYTRQTSPLPWTRQIPPEQTHLPTDQAHPPPQPSRHHPRTSQIPPDPTKSTHPPGEMATAADGTHRTVMHCCLTKGSV